VLASVHPTAAANNATTRQRQPQHMQVEKRLEQLFQAQCCQTPTFTFEPFEETDQQQKRRRVTRTFAHELG